MGHLSSMFSGLARSLALKKGKNSSGCKCNVREAAEAMAKEAKKNDLILRTSGTVNVDGSNNLASVFSKRGNKGVNQDCCIVWEEFGCQQDMMFCGIFDGHGQWGHFVAKRIRDTMPPSLLCNWQETLAQTSLDPDLKELDLEPDKKYDQRFNIWKHSYIKTCAAVDQELEQDRKINSFYSGTTGLTIVRQGDLIVIANVGDSRAVLGTTLEDGSLAAVQLTVDFKPNLPEEAERITQRNGRVFILRSRKKLEDKNEGKSLQDFYGSWSSTRNPSGQFDNQLPSLMVQSSPTSVLGHKRQLQGPESFPYQPVSNQFVSQTMYGTLTNACQATPVLSHTQPGQIKHQNFLSGSDISPGSARNKSADTCAKPTMTTQEKIEKLRRRQQLQAMLAIRKQQQQFSHQVSCTNQPTTQKCPQENQIQHSERADLEVEDLSTFPSLDPNSPIEQDDSNTVSAAVEYYSAEDTILYRLQDIIAKLDIKTRLCIRDSLLRLAQSAVQRHHSSDTSSSNRNSKDEPEIVAKEEIGGCNRYTSMPDVETETNPIDRTVAHLLFHRPLDLSGKHSGAPESPASTKMPFERKTAGLASLSNGVLLDSLKNKSNFSHQESGNYCPDPEPQSADQNLPCMNKSENLSNNGSADGGTMEVEASN